MLGCEMVFQGKEASPFVEQRRVTEDCLHLPATLAELKQAPLCSFISCCWCFRRLLTPSAARTRLIRLILTCRSKCSRSSICTVDEGVMRACRHRFSRKVRAASRSLLG